MSKMLDAADDRTFMSLFRISKELVENLFNIIDEYKEPIGRTSHLDTAIKVCMLVINIIL